MEFWWRAIRGTPYLFFSRLQQQTTTDDDDEDYDDINNDMSSKKVPYMERVSLAGYLGLFRLNQQTFIVAAAAAWLTLSIS